jgi:hypothetical protein
MARTFPSLCVLLLLTGASFCETAPLASASQPWSSLLPPLTILVSIPDQKLALVENGRPALFPVSTSKFGLGDASGSYKTPLGRLRVCDKLGDRLPAGAVIKRGVSTGEVVTANAAGRDAIVTRILWLDGLEEGNRNARDRGIYIHGTPEEERLGQAVSWGCIRMRSSDVISLFNRCPTGVEVTIQNEPMARLLQRSLPSFVTISPTHSFLPRSNSAARADWEPRIWFRLTLASQGAALPANVTDLRYTAMIQREQENRRNRYSLATSGGTLWR